uniref:Uncharacterized protein n=1 Tax=Knipowitschia caucasica TaxID=637954 RepID=A0AAV2JR93_KNICA
MLFPPKTAQHRRLFEGGCLGFFQHALPLSFFPTSDVHTLLGGCNQPRPCPTAIGGKSAEKTARSEKRERERAVGGGERPYSSREMRKNEDEGRAEGREVKRRVIRRREHCAGGLGIKVEVLCVGAQRDAARANEGKMLSSPCNGTH